MIYRMIDLLMMLYPTLPLDILKLIAAESVVAWRAMTKIPTFGRFTIECPVVARKLAQDLFGVYSDYMPGWPRGQIGWRLNGRLHCIDGPAVTQEDGQQEWFIYGWRHRDDGPAVIKANGDEYWWQHGSLHRDDGPAIIWASGGAEWRWHDQLHCGIENGVEHKDKPAIESDGRYEWYRHGQCHRDNSPAVIIGKYKAWYQNGKLHNENGPATVFSDSSMLWYINGAQLTQEEFLKATGK